MNYPKRQPFFAHRFTRLLHKAAVAAEIGRDAFSILVVVAHTEDAMRYRGPAKFWNSQLIETMGFSKWDQFDAARKRAIQSGWLCYCGSGKRKAGEYFVVIPEGYEEVSDTPIEESSPDKGYKDGYKDGYKAGYDQGVIEGMKRVQTGDEQGEPSNPVPIPNPLPKELQTPAFESLWSDWLKHRKEIRKPLTVTTTKKQLKKLAAMGEARSLAALEHTIANGWQGIREPETPTGPNNARPELAVQRIENEQSEVFNTFRAAAAAQCSESGGGTPARIGAALFDEEPSADDDAPNGNVARSAERF